METEIPWQVPAQLIYAFPLIGVVIGEILARLNAGGWVIPVNAGVGILVTCWWFGAFNPSNAILGLILGLSATGIHRAARQVGLKP